VWDVTTDPVLSLLRRIQRTCPSAPSNSGSRLSFGHPRGAEAFDLLQALNTGHLGSLSTIHANSAEQAFTRLAHCVLTANVGLPHRSTREAIALAIHLVVHIARVGPHRRVTEIVAVREYDSHTDRFVLESQLNGPCRKG
jgi:pilus assembly protein CpaF